MKDSEEHKETLIYILNQIADVDGERDIEEIKFISEIARRLHLTEDQKAKVNSSDDFEMNIPKSENDRIYFFFHALQLVEMDNRITSLEIEALKKVGFKLGLSPLLVKDLIELYVSHLGESISFDKIPFILKKYLN